MRKLDWFGKFKKKNPKFFRVAKSHGFRHRRAQLSAIRKGRFFGRSSRFGL